MLMSKLSNTISHENYSYLPPYLFLFIWGGFIYSYYSTSKTWQLWQKEGQPLCLRPVLLLSCLQQRGRGAQALQNADLDKEAKREGLPLHSKPSRRWEKNKAFQGAAPSPGTSNIPLQLGKCWVDTAEGSPCPNSHLGSWWWASWQGHGQNCCSQGLVPMARHLQRELASSCLCFTSHECGLCIAGTSAFLPQIVLKEKDPAFSFSVPHSGSRSWPKCGYVQMIKKPHKSTVLIDYRESSLRAKCHGRLKKDHIIHLQIEHLAQIVFYASNICR